VAHAHAHGPRGAAARSFCNVDGARPADVCLAPFFTQIRTILGSYMPLQATEQADVFELGMEAPKPGASRSFKSEF
jgi:hypothetical protein